METGIIKFENETNAKTVFFFAESESNGRKSLFRDAGNAYTTKLRGKFILIDRSISRNFPSACYLKINEAIEKESCFIVTSAELINTYETTREVLDKLNFNLITRPGFAIPETIEYYNAKCSIDNRITCLIVKYKMRSNRNFKFDNHVYFDCYINDGERIYSIESPTNISKSINRNVEDYSTLYFNKFERIK